MRKSSILLLVGALAITASLLVGPTATAGPDRASAGTVVFVHDQEPPNLQGPWVGNNLYATTLVLNNIWYGGQIRNEKADFVPRLFTGAPKIVKVKPLTIQFQYKNDAEWSDGKEVTCADLRATWQVFINPTNNVVSRTGWEDIKSFNCNGKRGTIVFEKVYSSGVASTCRRTGSFPSRGAEAVIVSTCGPMRWRTNTCRRPPARRTPISYRWSGFM